MSRSFVLNLNNTQPFQAINVLSDPGAIAGPVVVPSAAQIVFRWGLDDAKNGRQVLYGRYAGSFSGTAAQANAIMSALTTGGAWTALAAFFSSTSFFGGIEIRDVNTPNNAIIGSTNSSVLGTSASPSLPNEVAAVVSLKTAKVGQAFRGRSYVPGWATNALGSGNVIAPAAVTALQNWANTWQGAFTAQGYTLTLGLKARQAYTGVTGRQHPARAATTQDVTQLLVRDNHWDSQRRRGLK